MFFKYNLEELYFGDKSDLRKFTKQQTGTTLVLRARPSAKSNVKKADFCNVK